MPPKSAAEVAVFGSPEPLPEGAELAGAELDPLAGALPGADEAAGVDALLEPAAGALLATLLEPAAGALAALLELVEELDALVELLEPQALTARVSTANPAMTLVRLNALRLKEPGLVATRTSSS